MRVAIVTVAAQGIGKKTAELFALNMSSGAANRPIGLTFEYLRRCNAQAVLLLADADQSGFVNGYSLTVDGGWTHGWQLGEFAAAQALDTVHSYQEAGSQICQSWPFFEGKRFWLCVSLCALAPALTCSL